MRRGLVRYVLFPIYCLVGGTLVTVVALEYGWFGIVAFTLMTLFGTFTFDELLNWAEKHDGRS